MHWLWLKKSETITDNHQLVVHLDASARSCFLLTESGMFYWVLNNHVNSRTLSILSNLCWASATFLDILKWLNGITPCFSRGHNEDLSDAPWWITLAYLDFCWKLKSSQNCKKRTIFVIEKTITQERRKKGKQMPFFHLYALQAGIICKIHFCIWKSSKISCQGILLSQAARVILESKMHKVSEVTTSKF